MGDEIEQVLHGGYDRAFDLLNRNREAVKAIAVADIIRRPCLTLANA